MKGVRVEERAPVAKCRFARDGGQPEPALSGRWPAPIALGRPQATMALPPAFSTLAFAAADALLAVHGTGDVLQFVELHVVVPLGAPLLVRERRNSDWFWKKNQLALRSLEIFSARRSCIRPLSVACTTAMWFEEPID